MALAAAHMLGKINLVDSTAFFAWQSSNELTHRSAILPAAANIANCLSMVFNRTYKFRFAPKRALAVHALMSVLAH